MDNTTNKVIIITGGSSGIGKTTGMLLAKKGYKVVLAARNIDKLKEVYQTIQSEGGDALIVATDVTQRNDLIQLVEKTIDKYGHLDVMMNDAGIMAVAPLKEVKVEEWERMIDVNIKGLLYGVAATLPLFLKQGYGHYINLSSVAGIKVLPNGAVYSATKSAIAVITEGIRQELGRTIRTATIQPGAVDTPLKINPDKENQKAMDDLYQVALNAEDIARTIEFILSQPDNVDINQIVVRPKGLIP